jgi:uncharacterized Ntn-hydrolase superfamily protein
MWSQGMARRRFLKTVSILAVGAGVKERWLPGVPKAATRSIPARLKIGTFSIAAYDAESEAWGLAITSRALASGAFLIAKASVGAIMNQALPDISAGYTGLELLEQGNSAQEVLDVIVNIDSMNGSLLEPLRAALQDAYGVEIHTMRDIRQIAIIDATGNTAAFTGSGNVSWAGHIQGAEFTCQGNSLVSSQVLDAMAETYTSRRGDFADRLLAALKAGQEAGGDSRRTVPRNSAGLLVVKEAPTQFGIHDRFIDLRVDLHDNPIDRLIELREVHRQDYSS